MQKTKLCVHQFIRPNGPYIKLEGVGNCKTCVPDEKNWECAQYKPIAVVLVEGEEI